MLAAIAARAAGHFVCEAGQGGREAARLLSTDTDAL